MILFEDFFDIQTLPFYILGVLVFFVSIIDDLRKNEKTFWWYLQDFFYSMLSVSIGISTSYLIELPKAGMWIVTIGCGIIGSTIIRKIDDNKEKLSDKTIDRVADATIKKIEEKICLKKDDDNNNKNEENVEI